MSAPTGIPCLPVKRPDRKRHRQTRERLYTQRRLARKHLPAKPERPALAAQAGALFQRLCEAVDHLNDALNPAWNLLPTAAARSSPEQTCAADPACVPERVTTPDPVHASVAALSDLASRLQFTARPSDGLKQRGADASLDGVVVLIGDPDHDDTGIQQRIDEVVRFLYRRGDLHFIECPPDRLPRKRSMWRGIAPVETGRHGGTVGMDDAALSAAAIPSADAFTEAGRELLRYQLEFLGHDDMPGGRPLSAMNDRQLAAVAAAVDDEVEARGWLMKLAVDDEYQHLVRERHRLGQAHEALVRQLAGPRSVKMASTIASHVHTADGEHPSTCYIASAGAGHLDVMVAELTKQGITDYLVLCHALSRDHGHARVCR